MTVAGLRRYPVKSMLGEDLPAVDIDAAGFAGDRVRAVIDCETGRVATAKHPRLWRRLLSVAARWEGGAPVVTLPDGATLVADDPAAERRLSGLLERDVRLSAVRPAHATVARPDPRDVIAAGEDADVPYEILEIGQGTPGTNFVDYAPVHLITTATLAQAGVEMIRYRPNLVLDNPDDPPFAENRWAGRVISIGAVRLQVVIPTPRCAVPTLAHGMSPSRPEAVRVVFERNSIDVPGFGVRPCLGAYAEVLDAGTVAVGDIATIS